MSLVKRLMCNAKINCQWLIVCEWAEDQQIRADATMTGAQVALEIVCRLDAVCNSDRAESIHDRIVAMIAKWASTPSASLRMIVGGLFLRVVL